MAKTKKMRLQRRYRHAQEEFPLTKYAPEIVRYLNWRYGSDGKRMVGAGAQAASASQRAGAGAGDFR